MQAVLAVKEQYQELVVSTAVLVVWRYQSVLPSPLITRTVPSPAAEAEAEAVVVAASVPLAAAEVVAVVDIQQATVALPVLVAPIRFRPLVLPEHHHRGVLAAMVVEAVATMVREELAEPRAQVTGEA